MKREDFPAEDDTLPPRQPAITTWWRRNEGWLFWVFVALLVGGVFALPGCADTSRRSAAQDEHGQLVSVVELPGVICPQAVTTEPNAGCAYYGWVLFGYGWDRHVRAHEFQHVAGLRHGIWKNGCAEVLKSGSTQWTVGNYICRTNGGDYYERAK